MHAERQERFLHEWHRCLSARRDRIVERWYAAIAHETFSPFAAPEILVRLGILVDQAIAILTDVPFATNDAEEIGVGLVHLRYLDPAVLHQTISVLGEELGKNSPVPVHETLRERLPALLGAIAAGHTKESRALVLDEQEGIRAALFAERERIMTALYESEVRFRAIFANAAIGITLADLDGYVVECNPAVERILGYRQDELQRIVFTEITDPADVDEDRGRYDELIAGKRRSYHKEKHYIHKQGHIVSCNLTASLLRDGQNAPQFVLGMIEDITERKRVPPKENKNLHLLNEREQAVLQRLAEGLTQEQIAKVEDLRVRTVGRIVASLHEKLDTPSLVALGVRAAQLGLVH